jgi:hypothetical protein
MSRDVAQRRVEYVSESSARADSLTTVDEMAQGAHSRVA